MAPRPAANPRIASVTASGPVQARVPGGEQMKLNMLATDRRTPASGTRPIATPAASTRRIDVRRLASSAAAPSRSDSRRGLSTIRRIESSTRNAPNSSAGSTGHGQNDSDQPEAPAHNSASAAAWVRWNGLPAPESARRCNPQGGNGKQENQERDQPYGHRASVSL